MFLDGLDQDDEHDPLRGVVVAVSVLSPPPLSTGMPLTVPSTAAVLRAYVEQCLAPTLVVGDIVVADNSLEP